MSKTLKEICEAMKASYGARLVKLEGTEILAFETERGLRLLVERKNGKVIVFSSFAEIE